jgi:hypothetical protein
MEFWIVCILPTCIRDESTRLGNIILSTRTRRGRQSLILRLSKESSLPGSECHSCLLQLIGFSPSTITTICGVCISSTSTSIPLRGIRKLCSNARYRNVAASSALRPLREHHGWVAAIFKTKLVHQQVQHTCEVGCILGYPDPLDRLEHYAESCCEGRDLATRSSLYRTLSVSYSGSQPYLQETLETDSQTANRSPTRWRTLISLPGQVLPSQTSSIYHTQRHPYARISASFWTL